MLTLEKPCKIRDWLQIHRLYRTAFPPAERKPFGVIRRMYTQGRADVWRIISEGRFSGFAATVNGGELILLDYLAVDSRCRGMGIGSGAMRKLLEIYRGKGFFVEIESTRQGSVECQRRKRFYMAAGLRELNTTALVFGVEMELLGTGCSLDFDGYRDFYRNHYSPWAAEHLKPMEEKEHT